MKSIFNIVIFHFATLNNQRVTEKKTEKSQEKTGCTTMNGLV